MDFMNLSIKTLSVFMQELAIEWSDGSRHLVSLENIRRACPCAGCRGEKDVFGNIYSGGPKQHKKHSFQLQNYETVGLYGLRFFWKDGHHDGIYTFKLLYSLNGLNTK